MDDWETPCECVASQLPGGEMLMMIPGDGCTSEELFRYAGRASMSGGREQEAREVVVMGRKWKVEVCPSLRWFVQVTPDWRDAQRHAYSSDSSAEQHTLCLCSLPRHDEAALEEPRRGGGVERVWCSGGVITRRGAEGWEPNGYFILSIGVCKWKCQSGWKTNESDRRDATSLAERLINCHCLRWPPMFFAVIFWLFSPPGLAVLRLRVWWRTLSRGNKGIDPRQGSMLSSVTYKCGACEKWFWIRVL